MGKSAAWAFDNDATRALRISAAENSPQSAGADEFAAVDFASELSHEPSLAEHREGLQLLSYEMGPKIGAGGMGVVYQAIHVWLARTVAIKFIASAVLSDPESVARFHHEARAIGGLDHPNIVRATDAGCVDGIHFLVTEYVDGCDLVRLVKQCGPLNVADACDAIRQIALGLQHAHEQGLVHRDVKPSNLRVDRAGVVKLLDFGLARMVSGQTTMTGTGQMLGTLDFLAPEQASDARHVDIRADIYSLGCTFYFLLTGNPPFSGPEYDTPASKIKGHLTDTPQVFAGRNLRLPVAVSRCLGRMLAKDPADRFQTPKEVASVLSSFVKNANLAKLVHVAAQPEAGGYLKRPSSSSERTITQEWIDLATGTYDLFRRCCRRIFIGRPSYGGRPQKGPLLSFSSIVAFGFLAFFLSQFTCVPIGPDGMPGPPGSAPPGIGASGAWQGEKGFGVFIEEGELAPKQRRPQR